MDEIAELKRRIADLEKVVADVPACTMNHDWYAANTTIVSDCIRKCIREGR